MMQYFMLIIIKNIYTTWYSEDDAHSIKLISIKNYLTSQGYGCQTDIYK